MVRGFEGIGVYILLDLFYRRRNKQPIMSYYDIDAILTDAQVCHRSRPSRRPSKEHADLIST